MAEGTPPNIQTLKKKQLKCHTCGKSVATGPRLVIAGHWTCADCTYIAEYGETERKKRRRITGPPQDESLFPLPEPVSDVRKRP